jgi:hypothetical protein
MRITRCIILAIAAAIGFSACENYSHNFESLGLDFSTPEGNPIIEMSDDGNTEYFFIVLQDGTSMYGIIEDPDLLVDKSLTSANAESLWIGRGNKEHSPLTTDRLEDGSYVVSGRYLDGQSMHTKALTVIDLDNDGDIDYCVDWIAFEKIDLNIITYIATHTNLRAIEPKWD